MILEKLISWLESRKTISSFIFLVYFISVVLPHKAFGTFLNSQVFKGITRDQYNRYVLILALLPLLIYIFIFLNNSRKVAHRNKIWMYITFNIVAAILIIRYLFVINIEMIHFPQYAIMAIILFPIIGNYTATLIWATIAGAVDEAYQYFYLAPLDTSYFDFNDVLTNLVGAVFGLLLLSSYGIKEQTTFSIKKSSIWYGFGFITVVVAVLHLLGILSIYPNDERSYHIVRQSVEGFWTTTKVGVIYHIVRPLEGLLLTLLLWFLFSSLAPKKQ